MTIESTPTDSAAAAADAAGELPCAILQPLSTVHSGHQVSCRNSTRNPKGPITSSRHAGCNQGVRTYCSSATTVLHRLSKASKLSSRVSLFPAPLFGKSCGSRWDSPTKHTRTGTESGLGRRGAERGRGRGIRTGQTNLASSMKSNRCSFEVACVYLLRV